MIPWNVRFEQVQSDFLFFKGAFNILNWDIFLVWSESRWNMEPNKTSERPSIPDHIRLEERQKDFST